MSSTWTIRTRPRSKGAYDPVPEPVGDPRIDAWIGAAGEHLAQRWGLRVPTWTQRAEHFALRKPVFHPDSRALRGVLIVESPPAFRSRLLFTRVEPLDRARFPAGVARARTALQWPKPAHRLNPSPSHAHDGKSAVRSLAIIVAVRSWRLIEASSRSRPPPPADRPSADRRILRP